MGKLKAFIKYHHQKGHIKNAALALFFFGINMLGLLAILILITFGWPHL